MTEPLVSVIINCYNSEKYLRETIDSLIAQSYENWEAIFWDNCSTDKTSVIIASYNEPRFRYFLAERNTPLGEARNLAMDKVCGDYLCFLDSDDVWEKDFIERGVNKLNANPTLVGFYSNFYLWKDGIKRLFQQGVECKSMNLSDIIRAYKIGMSACMVNYQIIKDNRILFNNTYKLVEDFDFFIKIACYGNYFYDKIPLMSYRIYTDSNTFKHKDKWVEEYERIYAYFVEALVKKEKRIREEDLYEIKKKIIINSIQSNMFSGNRIKALSLSLQNITRIPIRWNIVNIIKIIIGRKL